MNQPSNTARFSPWNHRLAWVLCVVTFPVVWAGGLITTTDAGMAVPDWPGTYGYNMFLYPWQSWVFGPWDLFIEHGHRLMAAVAGMLSIGFLATTIATGSPRWMVRLAVFALALVIFQGVLGGTRVLLNERVVGMAHGCTGPLFFTLTCVLVALTSRLRVASRGAWPMAMLAAIAAGLAYTQLVLGASLRHADAGVGPWSFALLVKLHLTMAAVVGGFALAVAFRAMQPRGKGSLGSVTRWLGGAAGLLVTTQIGLGVATWLVEYGSPRWAAGWLPATISAVEAGGWTQTHTASAHQAVGALLLGVLTATAALAWRTASAAADPADEATTRPAVVKTLGQPQSGSPSTA